MPVNPRRAGVSVGWRAEPMQSVDRRRRTGDGAPYGARGNVSALQTRRRLSYGRGVGDAAPYGLCV